MISDRESNFFNATLAQQTRRYDDMLQYVNAMATSTNKELTVDERNLFVLAQTKSCHTRRASWLTIVNLERREQANQNKSHTKLIKQYREKIEKQLIYGCEEILDLLDNHLIPLATSDESKVIYLKMK